MATITKHHIGGSLDHKSLVQKVSIGLGAFFVILGLIGIVFSGFLGMHLSLTLNFLHLLTGSLALWCGFSDSPRKAYNFCVGFGIVYGLIGLTGFIIGQPGYPGVGAMVADENLMRVIPNVLELGTADHAFNSLIAVVMLATAYLWNKKIDSISKKVVETQSTSIEKGPWRHERNIPLKDAPRHTDTGLQRDGSTTPGIKPVNNRPDSQTHFEERL